MACVVPVHLYSQSITSMLRLGLGLSDQVLTLGPSALNGDEDCSDEMLVCGSRAVLRDMQVALSLRSGPC